MRCSAARSAAARSAAARSADGCSAAGHSTAGRSAAAWAAGHLHLDGSNYKYPRPGTGTGRPWYTRDGHHAVAAPVGPALPAAVALVAHGQTYT